MFTQIKATLSVIEDERNRWFENFMGEQKARQELEGIYLTFTLNVEPGFSSAFQKTLV